MIGLCIRFGWLPDQALKQDWATLAALQARLKEAAEQRQLELWENKIRRSWNSR